jgi:DNA-binding MarR family transcriptional regulator
MLNAKIERVLEAYPAIFLACHRRPLRTDPAGRVLTELQVSLLEHLDPAHPMTPSQLAEQMGIGRSSVSILLERLIRSGYVARRADPDDGRRARLTLTAAGARMRADYSVLDRDLLRKLLRTIAPAELESALRGLECLARHARILLRQGSRSVQLR